MNNELIKTFENADFGKIRVTVIDGKPMLCLADVCRVLELKNPAMVKTRLNQDGISLAYTVDSLGRNQQLLFIDVPNFFRAVFQSSKPEAMVISNWVVEEVLPTIMKTGSYSLQPQNNYMLQAPKTYADALRALADETEKTEALQKQNLLLESKIEVKDQQIAVMQPKASYVDTILQSKDLVPTKLIAKDYGLSAERLNTILRDAGIQYKEGGRWYLYQKYAEMNLGQSKTFRVLGKDGEIQYKPWLCWTQSGRFFINDLLKSMNILPIVERPKQISLSEYDWGELWP